MYTLLMVVGQPCSPLLTAQPMAEAQVSFVKFAFPYARVLVVAYWLRNCK